MNGKNILNKISFFKGCISVHNFLMLYMLENDVLEYTVSGERVSFTTNLIAPLKKIVVEINPIQSGSGDPSPNNIRPISGMSVCNIYNSPTSNQDDSDKEEYNISWETEAGTIYGGTLTINRNGSGKLIVNRAIDIFPNRSSITDSSKAGSTGKIVAYNIGESAKYVSGTPTFIMEKAKACIYSKAGAEGTAFINSHKTINLYVASDATIESVNNSYAGSKIVYELENPIEYNLTALDVVKTLRGANNVWADTGNIAELTYLKKG